MPGVVSLEEIVRVSPRFMRSIALGRDFDRAEALEGYILTPTGRSILTRFIEALRGESPARAWSLTGPYGAGKSAFALFVAQLLGGAGDVRRQARRILDVAAPELAGRLFSAGSALARNGSRLCPVLVSGTREPLEKVLAGRLAAALRRVAGRGRPCGLVAELERLAEQPSLHGGSAAAVSLFEQALDLLERYGLDGAGLLLIIDELGKFLEYGAAHPDRGDVFVLQGLAEAAARAGRPFLFLTVLHQSFDHYAEHVSPARRTEWAKVQGRFEDVAFEERTEEVVHLLSEAIDRAGADNARKALDAHGRALGGEAWELGIRLETRDKASMQQMLARCFPLHPLVALVVGPLFRQLAQNERTLFAFLTSGEPFALQEFLRQHSLTGGICESYRLDRLYDYVTTAVGPSLFAQQRGKHWAEVQNVLDRLQNASALEIRIAKVIGLLQALGNSSGLTASSAVLRFALKGPGCSGADIDAAVKSLCHRSLAVFRRHTDSYVLWEGSDLDIEAKLEEGRQAVDPGRGLASFLAQQVPPRPLVARRHSLQTGTLRFFETCYAGSEELSVVLHRDLGDADGRVIYCLPLSTEDRQRMEAILRSPLEGSAPAVVAALPTEVLDLREWCHELASLQWFWHHTPELQTDPVARRELRTRLTNAENALKAHLESLFRPAEGAASRCRWYSDAQELELRSPRQLNDYLSKLCTEVYPHTPICRNELLNRRSLSSSAAAARRTLLQAMIEHAEEEALGIKGTPPERSMYESILRLPGFHRKQNGVWSFHPPKGDAAMARVWQAIDQFLTSTETARQPIQRLFALLRRPPFGLKEGVLPVLLTAALLHFDAEVAFYEEGTFVPRLSPAIIERILRASEKFEVQRCRITGSRSIAFRKYAAMLNRGTEGEIAPSAQMLDIVRGIVRVVRQLPDYVSKTRTLSHEASGALKVIREARQPTESSLGKDSLSRSQARPGNALSARLCLACRRRRARGRASQARRSQAEPGNEKAVFLKAGLSNRLLFVDLPTRNRLFLAPYGDNE